MEVKTTVTAVEIQMKQTAFRDGTLFSRNRSRCRNRMFTDFSRPSCTFQPGIKDRVLIDPTSGSGSLLVNIG